MINPAHPEAGRVAYCRVSTADQITENQAWEIDRADFAISPRRTITETICDSVATSVRPGFAQLMDRLELGDELVVTKLDRLRRNAMDVRQTVEALADSGVRVHCLALGGVDLTSPASKMTMRVIAAVAEFERDLLIERIKTGIAMARAEVKHLGRAPTLDALQVAEVISRVEAGATVSDVAREYRTSRTTI